MRVLATRRQHPDTAAGLIGIPSSGRDQSLEISGAEREELELAVAEEILFEPGPKAFLVICSRTISTSTSIKCC